MDRRSDPGRPVGTHYGYSAPFLIAAVAVGLRNDRAGGNVAECGLRDSAKRSKRFAPRGAATVS
jgi:hypothetical protein